MPLVLADRVRETTTTAGTGTVTLAGAVTGYQTFAAVGNGNTTYYCIAGQGTSEWEVGIGTYTSSGTTLSRDTVLASSAGGAKVTFSAGTKDVFVTYPSGKSINEDASDNVGIGTTTPAAKLDIASGNLLFSSTGQRITGDMSNATQANRLAFQSSTVNGNTAVAVLPNGTSTIGSYIAFNNSDPTNAAFIQIQANASTEARLVSGITGTGTFLPMTFYTGGSERVRVDTSGNVAVGTTNAGTAGLSLSQNYNLSWEQSATESISNLFRQTSSAALVMSVGYKRSATANGFASSFGSSLAKTAISLGTTAGAITFYTDTAATTAVGTDVTPTERMRITSSGNVGIGTASPSGSLQVSAGNTRVRFSNTTGTASTLLFGADSGQMFLGAETNAPIYFITNNTERMRIDASGNVGIGTASPGYRLDVQAATASTLLKSTTGTNYAAHFLNNTGGFTYLGIESSAGGSLFSGTAAYSAVFGTVNAYPVALATNNTERMRIDSSGNVGIGISPFDKLDVNGGATVRGNLSVYSTTISQAFAGNVYGGMTINNGTVQVAIATNTNLAELRAITNHPLALYTNNTERMRIDSSGNVGIGGISSGNRLEVYSANSIVGSYGTAGYGSFYARGSGTNAAYVFLGNATNGEQGRITALDTGVLTFSNTSAATERMRIDSSGNVGIGATPSFKLDVNGGALGTTAGNQVIVERLSTTTSNADHLEFSKIRVTNGTDWTTAGWRLQQKVDLTWQGYIQFSGNNNEGLSFGTGGSTVSANSISERMRIDNSGNVGIGTSSPASKLDVYAASGTVTQYVRSAGSTGADIANLYVLAGSTNVQNVAYGSGFTYDICNPSVAHQTGTYSNAPVIFVTNTTERMRITATGNVGIGNSNPDEKLLVAGAITTSGQAAANKTSAGTFDFYAADNATRILSWGSSGVGGRISFWTGNGGSGTLERMKIDGAGNIIAGASAALATNATNGFLYVPTCAGVPTGTPTTITGMAPIVVDTTNNRWYFYSGGAWRNAGP